MHSRIRVLIAVAGLVLGLSQCQAQQTMNNDAVLKLEKAGLGDDLIVSTINGQPGKYSMSADDMIALKKAGVSDKVMGAMMAKNAGVSTAPAAAPAGASSTAPVDEVGVYYQDKDGKWAAFMPEIVNFKTGGFLKSMATAGVVKGDLNGHIAGATSKTDLTNPITILIYTPEGTAPSEYQLLKLHANSDNREFRAVTGGVVHASTGAVQDRVEFQANKIAPRSYTFTLPQGSTPGQYGLLPPGASSSSNSASAGKIYTFHLVE